MKTAAEWFYNTVFKEEPIRPREARRVRCVPAMITAARSLENGGSWQSREAIFLKQGKLLANYEDTYECQSIVLRYYPTYQALPDQELRGYFSWRTKLRRGDIRRTSLSFAFLYIYELLNQIGAADPMDGYRKLLDFQAAYGELDPGILPYLKRWLLDYVVYYELDAALLSDSPQIILDRSITVLEHIQEQDGDKIISAVRRLSPKWLGRSKFYAACREDMDAVIVRVLRRMSAHYAARCKKTMVDQYFGCFCRCQVRLFESAVFCDPLKKRNCEYVINEQLSYRCEEGVWYVQRRVASPASAARLDALLKTIDSIMRQESGCRHPVKAETDTKWVLRTIQEEVQAFLAEKRAAEAKKVSINYSQLTRIRQDAAVTQEKLTVEEEVDAPGEQRPQPAPPETPGGGDCPLDPAEYRLLRCLLYGGDTGWVRGEGCLLSVLVDSINEKLYDVFLDSVLDDTPRLVEDYIDDLKEMVRP